MVGAYSVTLLLATLLASTYAFQSRSRLPFPSCKAERLNVRSPSTMMADKAYSVGIVGATGAVGEEILGVMEKRNFPVSSLKLFASEKSAGKKVVSALYGTVEMEAFDFDVVSKLDVVLLAVGGDFALQWGEKLAAAGVLVIDNSSAFRRRPEIPLIIPEINIRMAKGKRLIANPNCTTAIALMALWPIHQRFTIEKCIMSTYQAASGAGAPGMQELVDGMNAIVNGNDATNEVFAYPLPYNLIPHIDVFQDNQYTKEEMKVVWESQKIMDAPDMKVSCTCVRIPTLRAHAESITLKTEKPITAAEVRDMLSKAEGVSVVDNPALQQYPMPLTATKKWDIEVGRIRENDVFGEFGLDLFVCGDQLLRGAALNAVLIAEAMLPEL